MKDEVKLRLKKIVAKLESTLTQFERNGTVLTTTQIARLELLNLALVENPLPPLKGILFDICCEAGEIISHKGTVERSVRLRNRL